MACRKKATSSCVIRQRPATIRAPLTGSTSRWVPFRPKVPSAVAEPQAKGLSLSPLTAPVTLPVEAVAVAPAAVAVWLVLAPETLLVETVAVLSVAAAVAVWPAFAPVTVETVAVAPAATVVALSASAPVTVEAGLVVAYVASTSSVPDPYQ
jgi:hypothetical protein